MITRVGKVSTERGPELLVRLCRHFAKKVRSTFDERSGEVEFPWGHCRVEASDTDLSFRCTAADEEAMVQLQDVLNLHVGMFSRRDPLRVDWS